MDVISVIVPIYNVEKYLVRCLQSIIKQTYQNLEIILVDDGSTDTSGKLCDKFAEKDSRIIVIHKKNGGLSDARNVGIDKSSGSYLVFVDSDDWIDPDMISILYNVAQKNNSDIIECSYRNIYKDHILEETNCNAEIINGDYVTALEGMLDWRYFKPVAWNKLYKRNVIKDIRYPVGRLHEDEFTTYKYFYNAKKVSYIDVSKYNYDRTREDSITGRGFSEKNLDACWAFRERVDFFYEHNIVQLQRKMNDIYCWFVLDKLDKCFQYKIQGTKVKKLLDQMQSDIIFFENKDVDSGYIDRFKKVVEEYK